MAAIYLIGSGIAGLAAASVALWLGGGWFVAVLTYAIAGNLGFTAICLLLGKTEAEPRQTGLDREIVADLQAIIESGPESSQRLSPDRLRSAFPELRSRS